MRDHERLDVWRRAHDLALEVHRATAAGAGGAPGDVEVELRALARDVPALIVRGCARDTGEEFAAAMREARVRVELLGYRLAFARAAHVIGAVPYARLEARATQLVAMLASLARTLDLKLAGGARRAGRPGAAPARADAPDAGSSPRRSRARSTS